MFWQLAGVTICVLTATYYVAWQTWRAWFGTRGGCASCSCATKPATRSVSNSVPLISTSDLTARLRQP